MESLLNDQITLIDDGLDAFQQYWVSSFSQSEEGEGDSGLGNDGTGDDTSANHFQALNETRDKFLHACRDGNLVTVEGILAGPEMASKRLNVNIFKNQVILTLQFDCVYLSIYSLKSGQTALMIASKRGHIHVAKTLLSFGAFVHTRDIVSSSFVNKYLL